MPLDAWRFLQKISSKKLRAPQSKLNLRALSKLKKLTREMDMGLKRFSCVTINLTVGPLLGATKLRMIISSGVINSDPP